MRGLSLGSRACAIISIPVFDRGVDRAALLTMADAATRLGVSATTSVA